MRTATLTAIGRAPCGEWTGGYRLQTSDRETYATKRMAIVMAKKEDPGPSVKDKELYEEIREDGASKEKAARIANAAANSSRDRKRGGEGRSVTGRVDTGGQGNN